MKKILILFAGFYCITFWSCADNCYTVAGEEDDYYCEEDDIDAEDVEVFFAVVGGIIELLDREESTYHPPPERPSNKDDRRDPCSAYIIPMDCKNDTEAYSKVTLRIGTRSGIMPERVTLFAESPPSSRVLKTFENPLSELTVTTTAGTLFAEALYVVGQDTVTAMEGINIRVSPKLETCGVTCYEAEDVTLDLFLWDG